MREERGKTMKGYYSSIPWGMLLRRHYCHKCGARLRKDSSIRIVTPYDKDYAEYSTWRTGNRLTVVTDGDIQVKEYHFKCPDCQTITKYPEQQVLRKIQKKRGSRILSTQEQEEDWAWAENRISTEKMIKEMLWILLCITPLLIAIIRDLIE